MEQEQIGINWINLLDYENFESRIYDNYRETHYVYQGSPIKTIWSTMVIKELYDECNELNLMIPNDCEVMVKVKGYENKMYDTYAFLSIEDAKEFFHNMDSENSLFVLLYACYTKNKGRFIIRGKEIENYSKIDHEGIRKFIAKRRAKIISKLLKND